MLPEMSTASSRSRPVMGRVSISPTHCGRAAASMSRAQASPAAAASKGWRIQLVPESDTLRNQGTRKASVPPRGTADSHRRSSQGSGRSSSIQTHARFSPAVGMASTIAAHPRSRLLPEGRRVEFRQRLVGPPREG